MDWKIYESPKVKCNICNDKEAILLPICVVDGYLKTVPVCIDCEDKVPYKVIPIKVELDKGYIHMPHKEEVWENPDWNECKQVYNWKNYVSDDVKKIWNTFTFEQKKLLYENYERFADREDWD